MRSRHDQTQPRTLDKHIAEEDKQQVQSNVPREKAERDHARTYDEKLDEVGRESFPASDPPAQP